MPVSDGLEARLGDFIAGMTDCYALTQYRQHVGPVELPEVQWLVERVAQARRCGLA